MKTQEEVLAVLRQIETGEVLVTPDQHPFDVFAGNVSYEASNGWTFVIFNDCDDWDYVDSFAAPGEPFVSIFDRPGFEDVISYRPSAEVARVRWGFSEPETQQKASNQASGEGSPA